MRLEDCKIGARVRYFPVLGKRETSYIGTVRLDPWQLGSGEWVTHLKDVIDHPTKTIIHAAYVDGLVLLEPAP